MSKSKEAPAAAKSGEETTIVVTAQVEPIVSFDDKLIVIQKLAGLKEQFLTMENRLNELSAMSFSTDKMNCKIVIRDDQANTFETTNSNAIEFVVKELVKVLTKRKNEIRDEIESINL